VSRLLAPRFRLKNPLSPLDIRRWRPRSLLGVAVQSYIVMLGVVVIFPIRYLASAIKWGLVASVVAATGVGPGAYVLIFTNPRDVPLAPLLLVGAILWGIVWFLGYFSVAETLMERKD